MPKSNSSGNSLLDSFDGFHLHDQQQQPTSPPLSAATTSMANGALSGYPADYGFLFLGRLSPAPTPASLDELEPAPGSAFILGSAGFATSWLPSTPTGPDLERRSPTRRFDGNAAGLPSPSSVSPASLSSSPAYSTHPQASAKFNPSHHIDNGNNQLAPTATSFSSHSRSPSSSIFDSGAIPRYDPSVLSVQDPDTHPDPDHPREDGDGPSAPLWCEFSLISRCDARFEANHVGRWIAHHRNRHFPSGHLPSITVCWFCDAPPFSACGHDGGYSLGNGGDARRPERAANRGPDYRDIIFEARMRHIADHISTEGLTEEHVRADYYMYDHAYRVNVIGNETYRYLMSENDVPVRRGMTLVSLSSGQRARSPEPSVVVRNVSEHRPRWRPERGQRR